MLRRQVLTTMVLLVSIGVRTVQAKNNSDCLTHWDGHDVVGHESPVNHFFDAFSKETQNFDICHEICKNHTGCTIWNYHKPSHRCHYFTNMHSLDTVRIISTTDYVAGIGSTCAVCSFSELKKMRLSNVQDYSDCVNTGVGKSCTLTTSTGYDMKVSCDWTTKVDVPVKRLTEWKGLCQDPIITNGFVDEKTVSSLGGKLSFKCDDGFEATAGIGALCSEDGKFKPSTQCTPSDNTSLAACVSIIIMAAICALVYFAWTKHNRMNELALRNVPAAQPDFGGQDPFQYSEPADLPKTKGEPIKL
eukprot:158788_1